MRSLPLTRFNRNIVRASIAAFAIGMAALGGALVACSGSNAVPAGSGDGGGADGGPQGSDAAPDSGGGDAGTSSTVTFSYTPGWAGASKVEVVGGFGQTSDWSTTASFLTLTNDGTGDFSGTAQLPAGQYLYVYRITGDDAAVDAGAFARYAIDPSNSAYAACPSTSPTFDANNPNPCSQISVPQSSPTPLFHVTGTLTVDAQPAVGWLVEIERMETGSHHFFANRVTTGADGKYDLAAAQGSYDLQALYPTYMSQSDARRDPIADQALRRAVSAAAKLSADVSLAGHEVAFHDYASFAPTAGDAGVALPTSFTFGAGTTPPTRLAVYGGPQDIGDPFFEGAAVTTGQALFDGTFTTKQATTDAAVPGRPYFWGVERPVPAADSGVAWTDQSMVFEIIFQ